MADENINISVSANAQPVVALIAELSRLDKAVRDIVQANNSLKNSQQQLVTKLSNTRAQLTTIVGAMSTYNSIIGNVVSTFNNSTNAVNNLNNNLNTFNNTLAATRSNLQGVSTIAKDLNSALNTLRTSRLNLGPLDDYITKFRAIITLTTQHQNQLMRLPILWRQAAAGVNFNSYAAQINQLTQALTATINNATTLMNRLNQATNQANGGIQQVTLSWTSLQRMMTVHVGYMALSSITQAFREAYSAAQELSVQIGLIQTISQTAPKATEQWNKELVQLSNNLGLPVLDVAKGAYEAISNQVVDATNAVSFMNEAGKLSIATNATLAQSVNALSSVINSFGLKATDAGNVAAVLFRTVDLGRVTLDQMADTLGRSAVVTSSLGISMQDLGAQIATLTVKGFPFEHAQTQIIGLMQALLKPTTEMEKAFESWGVTTGRAAIDAFGFVGTMRKIQEYTQGNENTLAKLIPRVRGFSEALSILEDNAKTYEDILGKMNSANEGYANAVDLVLQTTGQKLKVQTEQFKNSFLETSQLIQKALVFITDNFVNLSTVGSGLSLILQASLIPSLWGLVKALTTMQTVLLAVKPYAIATAAIAGLLLLINDFRTRTTEAANTWYDSWSKSFDAIDKKQKETFNSMLSENKTALKKQQSEIAKYTSYQIAARNKAADTFFAAILKRGEQTGAAVRATDFDYTGALTSVMKKVKKELSSSEDDYKRYSKTVEKVEEQLTDYSNLVSALQFGSKISVLKDIPEPKDLSKLESILFQVQQRYATIKDNLAESKKLINDMAVAEGRRDEALKSRAIEEEIKNLEKQREGLKGVLDLDEKLKLEEEKLRKIRMTDLRSGEREKQANARIKEIDKENKILEGQLGKKLSADQELVVRRKIQANKEELETLNLARLSNKELTDRIKVIEDQRKGLVQTRVEDESLARQQGKLAEQDPRVERQKDLLKTYDVQFESLKKVLQAYKDQGDMAGYDRILGDLKSLSKEQNAYVDSTGLVYQKLADVNALEKQRLDDLEAIKKVAADKAAKAEEERAKAAANLKIIEDTKAVLNKIHESEKIFNKPGTTDEQRIEMLEAVRDAYQKLLGLKGSDLALVKDAIPDLENMLSLSQQYVKAMEDSATAIKRQQDLLKEVRDLEAQKAKYEEKAKQESTSRTEILAKFSAQTKDLIEKTSPGAKTQTGDIFSNLLKRTTLSTGKEFQNISTLSEGSLTDLVSILEKRLDAIRTDQGISTEEIYSLGPKGIIKTKEMPKGAETASIVEFLKLLNETMIPRAAGFSTEAGRTENIQILADQIKEKMNELTPGIVRESLTVKESFDSAAKAALKISGVLTETYNKMARSTGDEQITAVEEYQARGGYIKGYAKGGPVGYFARGGGPRGTDTIPAWLSSGEFVIQAKRVKELTKEFGKDFLTKLNDSGTSAIGDKLGHAATQLFTKRGNTSTSLLAQRDQSFAAFSKDIDRFLRKSPLQMLQSAMGPNPFNGQIDRANAGIRAVMGPSSFSNMFAGVFHGSGLVSKRPMSYNGPTRPFMRGYSSGGAVTNVGDINVSMTSSGNQAVDVQQLGRLLQREIRRGTVRFA